MIDDAAIERAVDWLRDTADEAAQARANREYMIEYRKVLKAQIMREYEGSPATIQERNAYSDQRYVDHLDAMKIAIEMDERLRWLASAAQARIEAWRTQSANVRINV